MIQVHLNQIPPNDLLHLKGESEPDFLQLEEAGATPTSALQYNLKIGISGNGLFATGSVSQKIQMQCVRCLEPFELEILNEEFALHKELPGTELVDISTEIREEIQLLIPSHPKCHLDHHNECPIFFSTEVETIEAQKKERSASIWSALDDIHL